MANVLFNPVFMSACGRKWCRHGRFWVSLNPRSVFTPDLKVIWADAEWKMWKFLSGACASFDRDGGIMDWGQYWGLLGILNGDQVALSMEWTWKEGGTNCWRTTTVSYIRTGARNRVRKWLILLGFPLVWTINLSLRPILIVQILVDLFVPSCTCTLPCKYVPKKKNKTFFVAWDRASRGLKVYSAY